MGLLFFYKINYIIKLSANFTFLINSSVIRNNKVTIHSFLKKLKTEEIKYFSVIRLRTLC